LVSGAHSFGVLLTASVGNIPEEARPAIQSLLMALALLSVFIVGLGARLPASRAYSLPAGRDFDN
jgi:hypothetical protein